MNNLSLNNFLIIAGSIDSSITLDWTGRSEERNPSSSINPYLNTIIEEAKKDKKFIIADFRKMEFMNSSTIPSIIKFLKSCSSNNINVKVLFDKNKDWQRVSFGPLKTVCLVLKGIEISAG